MAPAAGTGYLVNLIYYVSTGTVKMADEIPVPNLMALTSLMGIILLYLPIKTRLKQMLCDDLQPLGVILDVI